MNRSAICRALAQARACRRHAAAYSHPIFRTLHDEWIADARRWLRYARAIRSLAVQL